MFKNQNSARPLALWQRVGIATFIAIALFSSVEVKAAELLKVGYTTYVAGDPPQHAKREGEDRLPQRR